MIEDTSMPETRDAAIGDAVLDRAVTTAATTTHKDLVIAAARQFLSLIARNDLAEYVRDPAGLLAKGARSYTKTVLFPVRFLYTARTGEIGRNHDAAEHLVRDYPGAVADL